MKKQFILTVGLFCLVYFGNCNNLPESEYASCYRKCEEKKDICYIAMLGSSAPPLYYISSSSGGSGGSSHQILSDLDD